MEKTKSSSSPFFWWLFLLNPSASCLSSACWDVLCLKGASCYTLPRLDINEINHSVFFLHFFHFALGRKLWVNEFNTPTSIWPLSSETPTCLLKSSHDQPNSDVLFVLCFPFLISFQILPNSSHHDPLCNFSFFPFLYLKAQGWRVQRGAFCLVFFLWESWSLQSCTVSEGKVERWRTRKSVIQKFG